MRYFCLILGIISLISAAQCLRSSVSNVRPYCVRVFQIIFPTNVVHAISQNYWPNFNFFSQMIEGDMNFVNFWIVLCRCFWLRLIAHFVNLNDLFWAELISEYIADISFFFWDYSMKLCPIELLNVSGAISLSLTMHKNWVIVLNQNVHLF